MTGRDQIMDMIVTGGADGLAYDDFRNHLAADIRRGLAGNGTLAIFERAAACSHHPEAKSGEWTERFLRDLERGVARKAKRHP
jgi:hypothetical protein